MTKSMIGWVLGASLGLSLVPLDAHAGPPRVSLILPTEVHVEPDSTPVLHLTGVHVEPDEAQLEVVAIGEHEQLEVEPVWNGDVGRYELARSWPTQGHWVLAVSAKAHGIETGLLVDIPENSIAEHPFHDRLTWSYRGLSVVQVDHAPTEAEVEALLAGRNVVPALERARGCSVRDGNRPVWGWGALLGLVVLAAGAGWASQRERDAGTE